MQGSLAEQTPLQQLLAKFRYWYDRSPYQPLL